MNPLRVVLRPICAVRGHQWGEYDYPLRASVFLALVVLAALRGSPKERQQCARCGAVRTLAATPE